MVFQGARRLSIRSRATNSERSLSITAITNNATKQRSKLRRVLKYIGIVLALLFLYLSWQAWDIHNFGRKNTTGNADCAIVLGAAAWHNKPSPVFKERIRHGVELYKTGRVKMLILTGGYGKGAAYAESEVAKKFSLEQGVPESAIMIEKKSRSTEINITEAKILMDKAQLKSALIVSDPWHLKRACAMAKDSGINAQPSATMTTKYKSPYAQFRFLAGELYLLHYFYIFGE